MGVVVSILSLGPILAVVLGVEHDNITATGWMDLVTLVIFGYAVLMLLLSAYHSVKALKIIEYADYFTADGFIKLIEDGEKSQEELVFDLLRYKKRNELSNLNKTNTISVAESLTRNGLISLGIGITLLILL